MYKCIVRSSIEVDEKFFKKAMYCNKIITHSGVFHSDEIFSIAILQLLDRHWEDVEIVRTRDADVIKKAFSENTLILDVGEVFSPENGWIDHHQISFDKKYTIINEYGDYETIPMATCGCVWSLVSDHIIRQLAKSKDIFLNKDNLEYVKSSMKNYLFQIDAVDVGKLDCLGISKAQTMIATISMFNSDNVNDSVEQLSNFKKAINLAKMILTKKIFSILRKVLSREKIFNSLEESKNNHHEDYLIIEEVGTPWKEIVFENWEDFEKTKLVIFKAGEDDWRVQTLPLYKDDFTSQRNPAPVDLRGKSTEEIKSISGINDITFIHRSGFLGGVKSLKSAKKLVDFWLNN